MKGGPAEGGGGRIITFSAKKSGKADGGPPPEKGGGRKREIALSDPIDQVERNTPLDRLKREAWCKKGLDVFLDSFSIKICQFFRLQCFY